MKQTTNDPFEKIGFIVRSHYKMLPTSPDWLNMTKEQVLKEFTHISELNKPVSEDEEEQITYVDPDFDEWDKASDFTENM